MPHLIWYSYLIYIAAPCPDSTMQYGGMCKRERCPVSPQLPYGWEERERAKRKQVSLEVQCEQERAVRWPSRFSSRQRALYKSQRDNPVLGTHGVIESDREEVEEEIAGLGQSVCQNACRSATGALLAGQGLMPNGGCEYSRCRPAYRGDPVSNHVHQHRTARPFLRALQPPGIDGGKRSQIRRRPLCRIDVCSPSMCVPHLRCRTAICSALPGSDLPFVILNLPSDREKECVRKRTDPWLNGFYHGF
jgi:hypothetical protein